MTNRSIHSKISGDFFRRSLIVICLLTLTGCGGGDASSSHEDRPEFPQENVFVHDQDDDGFALEEGDCDDLHDGIFPQAPEVCGDGVDQDCDGADQPCLPEEQKSWFLDADGDRYGFENSVQSLARPSPDYFEASELLAIRGDCNDSNTAIHPGAAEICGDGIDQDCIEGDLPCPLKAGTLWYLDEDGDGYGEGIRTESVDWPGDGYFEGGQLFAVTGDCNDGSSMVHPGAAEVCGDGIDQDCSGADLACPSVETEFDHELRLLINAYREQNGLGILELDPHLHDLAQEHSAEMESTQTMSHDGFNDRFERSNYRTCVENVGWNYRTPEAMFEGWRNSPGHDENLRNGRIGWAGVSKAGAYITFFACGN